MTVGVTKIDRHNRNAGGFGRIDVGLRIADHQCAMRIATRQRDGLREMAWIGFAKRKRVLAGDCREMFRQAKRLDQRHRIGLVFVGADGQQITGGFEPGDRLDDAGVGARLAGDVVGVVIEKQFSSRSCSSRQRALLGGVRALDHHAAAMADEALEAGLVDGRSSLAARLWLSYRAGQHRVASVPSSRTR